jgi:uncharacterized membrane protein YbjE (DUF340 family)
MRRAFPNPFDLLRDGWTVYQIVKEIVKHRRKMTKHAAIVIDYAVFGLILGELITKELRRQSYPFRSLVLLFVIGYRHKMLRRGFKSTYAISKTP